MRITVSQESLNKLKSKINALSAPAKVYKWPFIVELLTKYDQSVSIGSGMVSATYTSEYGKSSTEWPTGRGGDVTITMRGIGEDSDSKTVHWNSLRPYTIKKKVVESGKDVQGFDMRDIYNLYADKVKIWFYTGETYQQVARNVQDVKAGGKFAGLESSAYASKMEFGEGMPKRPLFTVVSFLFGLYITRELKKTDSNLSKRIRKDFVQFAKEHGW